MSSSTLKRHHVQFAGVGTRPMVFAHGFGCDQTMWRFVSPAFEASHRVVLFDHMGCGRSDLSAFEEARHGRLEGYAQDLSEILEAADLRDAVLVGHSVSSIICALASIASPDRVSALVMIGPSARYLNDPPDYHGGFERADIEGLLEMMERNMLGWASFLSPMVMGASSPGEMTDELRRSFCAMDPYIARCFAKATFFGDNRRDLAKVTVPTQVIQMRDDAIAPLAVGQYVARQLPGARFDLIEGSGHAAHMTHGDEVVRRVQQFLETLPSR